LAALLPPQAARARGCCESGVQVAGTSRFGVDCVLELCSALGRSLEVYVWLARWLELANGE
jgi:hypothetical protein